MQGYATRALLFAGAAVAVMGLAGGAQAQPTAPNAAANDQGGPQLEEVIVTAQRRAERLENVPMAVSAVSPAAIERAGITSIHDLGQLVPGAQINFAGGFTQPTIRGITTLTTGVGFENNVAIYIDGFYSPDNVTVNGDLANISGIEVLKGPQGTLWGRNATGGAILINTKAPSKVLTGSLQASYGRYNDVSVSGYVSGPINDRVRFAVAGYNRKSSGYNDLLGPTGQKVGHASPLHQASVRTKLEVDVTDKLTATAAFNYGLASDARGLLFNYYQFVSPALPQPPARSNRPYAATYDLDTKDLGITREGTLKLAYQTPMGMLTSYTGFAHRDTRIDFDFDGSYANLVQSKQVYGQDTFQQGVDYNINAIDNLDLVVGGSYYQDALKDIAGISRTNTGTPTAIQHWTTHSTAWAVFVDATYHLTDKLALNVGGRYSADKKAVHNDTTNGTQTAFLAAPNANTAKFNAFTPRVSLRYEVAPRTNVYATWSKGYRTGGFNPVPGTPLIAFQPEKITAYEAGFKTARGWLRFDTAAFYYDYRQLQVGITVPNPNPAIPGVTNLTLNAPKAEVYGVDAEVTAEPVENLNIHAGVAYLHGRYKNFHNATGNGFNAATGLNVTGQVQDWSNLQMARAPRLSGSVGVDYQFQDVVGGKLRVGTNVSYTDSFPLSNPSIYGPLAGPALARSQRYLQKSYTLINAQTTWTDPSGHYRVTVYGNNLTDKRYRLTNNGGAFGDYSSWAEPRNYGVRLGYDF
jgi:iron complex outermembrane receptor protein